VVYWKILRNALSSDLEYRMSYVIMIFSIVTALIMDMAVMNHVFEARSSIGWLKLEDALAFLFVGNWVRLSSQLWSMVSEFTEEVRSGSFRRYLLQPVSFTGVFFARAIGPKLPTWSLFLISTVALKSMGYFDGLFRAGTLIPFIFLWLQSILLIWLLYLLVIWVAFWIEEAHFFSTAFNIGSALFAGTLLPLAWLPSGIQSFLSLTPLPLMGDLPVRAALDQLKPGEATSALFQGSLWAAGFLIAASMLQRRAYRRYEAFGG
jgi:ABC-2 type transport system permease protein